ncbi:PREDICTED: pelargonidin 3-O-(6-caffeoylglucoside) 5-O-(6-O-malonylglucoside) 4'''-malonyltransferase-like [Erythranthe guttata]|uniref:pelargonidin 3-O-(6-caffeoylglucoside) 5-O-(6-O-malonylglucoside) 4'''-malonyltransferase-like n=1 Tax=Erythranthe guttata TaxID=4155 RepID=UPI00064D9D7F|nr:PREDICTED: pelargonidin 3-O-(6-caffeoylglucoside) 5-O-(6-O-malonylglucoside) 4'''-malonyltransferase-like [Erythranthe guttata]|eukprot:XP_012841131.1 PREDICTED: pelargonidin 3-O-(6-caffeoylglucoside) 5-O-(6-O-malonylglucoside) 4'''-malonyltransferase-like [Erythranthe guttata]
MEQQGDGGWAENTRAAVAEVESGGGRAIQNVLQLAESLSERYIKNDGFVDCSDQGVEFVEAQVVDDDDVDFNGLVSKMEMEELNNLLSRTPHQVDELPTDPLLSVQVTEFKCGGLAIGVSVAHRIFDGYSFGMFVDAWSTANNNNHPNPGGEIKIICPSFDLATLFPGYGPRPGPSVTRSYRPSPIVKKFTFNKDAITSARSKLIQRPNSYYSRVRVVSAVLAKALMGVDRAKHGGKSRTYLICQAVNMRRRTNPPMHKYSCGNFAIMWVAQFSETRENVIGVQELVDNMGDSVIKTLADIAEALSQSAKLHSTIKEISTNIMEKKSTGEPVGVGIGAVLATNAVRLVSNKEGDGIEAWVHLNSNDMAYFEQDQDIKLLAT